ncbi:hypothetical protein, partial [Herbiconiux daphne]
TLSFVIATAIASFATNALAQAPATAPAYVTEAQHSSAIALENMHKWQATFNAAPASERAYAAEKLDAATNAAQTAVLAEKVAIKKWLTPPTSPALAPAEAPHVQHFGEPQNIAIPAKPGFEHNVNVPTPLPQTAAKDGVLVQHVSIATPAPQAAAVDGPLVKTVDTQIVNRPLPAPQAAAVDGPLVKTVDTVIVNHP